MPKENRKKILCYGNTAVDILPTSIYETLGNSASCQNMILGGKAANMAVSAAKNPLSDVFICSALGCDDYGDFATRKLQRAGIFTNHMQTVHTAPTLCIIINPDKPGKVSYLSEQHASNHLDSSRIVENIGEFDLAIAHANHNWDSQVHLMESCNAAGIKTIYNPAPVIFMKNERPVLLADIIISNESEALAITNMIGVGPLKSKFDLAGALKGATKKDFIVTYGDKGAIAAMGPDLYYAAPRPTCVVDATGAGDAFTGYFASAYINGENIFDCLRKATTAASIVCERFGAANSIPSLEEVDDTLGRTPPPVKIEPSFQPL